MIEDTPVPDPALRDAYLAAEYVVPLGGRLCRFRANAPPPEPLASWLHEQGPSGWLSAFNPGSRRLPTLENLRRHQRLWQRLRDLGLAAWVGYAVDPAGDWPDETGFLVRAIRLPVLNRLALEFGQAAVLWLQPARDTQLLFCQPEGLGDPEAAGDGPAP
ncbi:MAG TPA: DUF3293 domain-containing protein [Thioalkalivibrio sp.]|nr:DUF3293 domain-containing protein [Thioalkalivibrio sp.]